jgi:hypothetical protein
MRNKKKGYSLLMAIQAILVITVLATAMVTLAAASYRSSVNREKMNKLKLRAESGIEKQFSLLKEFIINNPIVLVDSDQYDLMITSVPKVDEPKESIRNKTYVTVDNNVVDTPTGRTVKCLKLESTAQYEKPDGTLTGREIKVTVYIDKSSVYNEYFESIFKNTFTTSPKEPASLSGPYNSSFYSLGNTLNLTGNMLLQGKVDFKPANLNMTEGNIRVKTMANEFRYITPGGINSGINRIKDAPGSADSAEWKNKQWEYLYFCDILDPASVSGSDILVEYTSPTTVIDISHLKFLTVDNTDPSNKQNTVTCKIRSISSPINFQWLVNGTDGTGNTNGLYYEIVNALRHDYYLAHLLHFGEYYKILLIDGDLEISDDTSYWYNNYIIYCSGKVTFKGKAFFYNSSVFAKDIQVDGDVVFNGVNTRESRAKTIGGVNLTDFKNSNKGAISAYLINNLESYGDFLQFRVVRWEEE